MDNQENKPEDTVAASKSLSNIVTSWGAVKTNKRKQPDDAVTTGTYWGVMFRQDVDAGVVISLLVEFSQVGCTCSLKCTMPVQFMLCHRVRPNGANVQRSCQTHALC